MNELNQSASNNEIVNKAVQAQDEISAIRVYCEERSKFDEQLAKGLEDKSKNYDKCWSYIMTKAKIHLHSKSGHIMPSIVFGWAVHYFTESDEDIKKEVGVPAVQETLRDITHSPIKKEKSESKQVMKKTEKLGLIDVHQFSIFDEPDESHVESEIDLCNENCTEEDDE